MNRRVFFRGWSLALALGLGATMSLAGAQDDNAGKKAIQQDRVVAGGPTDFMEVRHVVLRGSNAEIGQALATIAKERYQARAAASADPLRTRVQRRYFQQHYPIFFDRMRGVSAAFGKHVEDDAWDFSGLSYLVGEPGGCSVVFYPPGVTSSGAGIFSRNYDYSTGTLDGTRPKRGELPANARPYVIEMHPDRGYASLAFCAYDLLSGVLDGINSEGLTAACLSDYELAPKHPIDPAEEGGVGLNEVQMLRMLLDTCANVEEAKELLLMTKQYYSFLPQHYMIADRHGKAFVWEYSLAHNREYIVENPGKPLVTTNFSLHAYLDGNSPPSAQRAKRICARYCALAERIETERGKWTVDLIKQSHKAADIAGPGPLIGLLPPARTLWHALYFPDRRAVQVSFYLGDKPDPDQPLKPRIVRSEYLEFSLQKAQAAKE